MAKNFIQPGKVVTLPVGVGTKSGDPVLVGGVTGVSQIHRLADGTSEVALEGVYALSVKAIDDDGSSGVAVGDKLFYVDGDTPKISKKASGNFFGYALEAVTSGATKAIPVLQIAGPGPGSADILAGSITKTMLAGGFFKVKVIAGGAAGDLTVTGIAIGDELVAVLRIDIDTGAVVDLDDLTSEFTITASDKINNAGGSVTTGDKLLVMYLDLT